MPARARATAWLLVLLILVVLAVIVAGCDGPLASCQRSSIANSGKNADDGNQRPYIPRGNRPPAAECT
jgi:hypothetical protein